MTGKVRIVFALSVSIVLLVIIGFYAYNKTQDYKKASDWVNHTQQVIREAQKILLLVEDIETSQRGYVITGNAKYLEPYEKSNITIKAVCRRINELTQDNSHQQKLLDSICTTIGEKILFAQSVIKIRERDGFEASQKLVSTDQGELLMRKIRISVENFINHEEMLLSERLKISNQNFTSTLYIILLSVLLAAIVVFFTLFFFIKDHQLRIESERKLLESEQRIKNFFEVLPVGVFIIDSKGKPFYANSKSQEILGKGIIGDSSASTLPEVYSAYIAGTQTIYPSQKQPIVRALKGEKNISVEDMEIAKSGKRIPLRINATHIVNSEGAIEYAIAVFEDITEGKEAEKKLIEARKMAEQSAILKESFLANMSHEIRTPMNAILGFTDLLLKKNLGDQEKDYVRTIKTSGENLLRIINDVLDISKMESGMMTFEKHSINLREVFSSLKAMLAPKATDKNLRLEFDSSKDVPETIVGDPTRLTQILLNLVGNAIKFTVKGRVTVFAKTIKTENNIVYIEFSVSDTGIGIPKDKLEQVFERFRQAESHTARHYGGTGLGLSIAKELVDMQGGEMTVKSQEGLGSVFTFVLPFSTTPHTTKEEKSTNSEFDIHQLSSQRILLVEDNPINTKFVESLFAEYNISADHAEDGKEAIEKIKSKEYDVVLMDIDMPYINGYEATLIIRNELKSKTPIIAMTAHAIAGEKEKCLELGMNDYISKPIQADLLFSKMFQQTLMKNKNSNNNVETTKVVNLDFLVKSMRGKKEVIAETIHLIIRELPSDLSVLFEAISAADYSKIKHVSHKLKSTVSIAGIAEILAILSEMERTAAQEQNLESLKKQAEWLKSLGEKALGELKEEVKKYI